MKFFHLSDLHIGLRLFNRDLSDDQRYILRRICAAAAEEKPDAVVVAGDIYDRAVPSADAVQIFSGFVDELCDAVPEAEIMMISGNHDSAVRLDLFRGILQKQRIHMIGVPPQEPGEHIERVRLEDEYGPVNFFLLPFVKPSLVRRAVERDEDERLTYDEALHRLIEREDIDTSERNVLVSHQFYLPAGRDPESVERTDSEICTVGNIDLVSADILRRFDYGALGHIHRPMKLGSEAYRYCGTPLACSVSEAGQRKGIIMVELGKKGDVKTEVLPLEPLHQVRIIEGELEDVLLQGCSDYVSVMLTDKRDLDVIDMQDRLRSVFPNLLEIRRKTDRRPEYRRISREDAELDPFSLCSLFLKDMDEDEKKLLQNVINKVQGAEK